MRGISGFGLPYLFPYLQVVAFDDVAESVPSNWTVATEFLLVHVPQLHTANARIKLPYVMDKLQCEAILG